LETFCHQTIEHGQGAVEKQETTNKMNRGIWWRGFAQKGKEEGEKVSIHPLKIRLMPSQVFALSFTFSKKPQHHILRAIRKLQPLLCTPFILSSCSQPIFFSDDRGSKGGHFSWLLLRPVALCRQTRCVRTGCSCSTLVPSWTLGTRQKCGRIHRS